MCVVRLPVGEQVCGALLVKLVMDLWLSAGSGNSYPLVLRMLRKTLADPRPVVRARAFDTLYNLACHSALLAPLPAAPGVRASNLQHGFHSSQHLAPGSARSVDGQGGTARASFGSGVVSPAASRSTPLTPTGHVAGGHGHGSGGGAGEGAEASHVALMRWLRALTFQLVEDMAKVG